MEPITPEPSPTGSGAVAAPRNEGRIGRWLLLATAWLFIAALSWIAITGGVRQLPYAHSLGQRLETGLQLACGVLGPLVAIVPSRGSRLVRWLRLAWAGTFAGAAGLSSLVWGPPMPLVGLGFAAGALLIAWAVSWSLEKARPGR